MPTAGVVILPFLVLIMVLAAAGLGLFFSALCVQYRDVKHAAEFGIRLLMYAAPVVYPASLVPEQWLAIYALNPLVGVIEGFRAVLLGSRAVPWDMIWIGFASASLMAGTGLWYFRRQERVFADVV